jgi:hypothetical protein
MEMVHDGKRFMPSFLKIRQLGQNLKNGIHASAEHHDVMSSKLFLMNEEISLKQGRLESLQLKETRMSREEVVRVRC